jgi:hypothetical protein
MRRAARRDSNDHVLAHAAREMGARMVYAGPLDWWVGFRGKWFPVEIKNKDGKNRYTDSQKDFIKLCEQDRLPVWTWRELEDVVKSLCSV